MKAWLPRLSKPNVIAIKATSDLKALPGSIKLRSAASTHPQTQRYFHDSQIFSSLADAKCRRSYFSLAEKIREFLPNDAFEENDNDTDNALQIQPELERDLEEWSLHTSLAAYESEIYIAEKFAKMLAFGDLADFLVANLPLQATLTALVERIAPVIKEGPLGEIGVIELAYCLYIRSNRGLALHYLQAMGISDASWTFELVSILSTSGMPSQISSAENSIMTSEKVDLILNGLYPHLHFPQLLSQEDGLSIDNIVALWLKARVLAMLSWSECEKWLNRYFDRLVQLAVGECLSKSHLVAFLGLKIIDFRMFSRWASPDQENVVSLISITNNPADLHTILRPLLRPTKIVSVETGTAIALLKAALRQRQSYDIANICRSFNNLLIDAKSKQALLADALLAVAFAQKKSTPKDGLSDVDKESITMPTHSLRTPLVVMVLPSDPKIASIVVGYAAWKLQSRYKQRRVPGRVLWQLLSSLPHTLSLSDYAQSELTKLIVSRPYIEQIRFMALPFVTKKGLRRLLQWHVSKIIDYRRRNQVNWNTLQAKEDIQLLIIGSALAAEKVGSNSRKASSLHALINTTFEDGNSTTNKISENENHIFIDKCVKDSVSVSAWLILQITGELIANRNYLVVQQMLRMLGPKITNISFDETLLGLVDTHPAECYYFVIWFISEKLPARAISFATLDRLLLILIKESSLSESQIMNRFQTLRNLIGSTKRREISVEAAASFVDALIESSKLRNGGSRQRLKWALETAHKVRVPETYFERWTSELQKMNANKIGFWYGTP